MNITCEVVRDLLPLYHDNVCGSDSRALVEEHLAECAACREELHRIETELTLPHIEPDNERSLLAVSSAWKKRKKRSFVAGALIAVVILIGAFVVYSYLTPSISVGISKPVDPNAESYIQQPAIAYSTNLGLPLPQKIRADMAEFAYINEATVWLLREQYTQPMRISVTVEEQDGRMLVTYFGQATDEGGELVEINQELEFNFTFEIRN